MENMMETRESEGEKYEEICSGEYKGDECETIPGYGEGSFPNRQQ